MKLTFGLLFVFILNFFTMVVSAQPLRRVIVVGNAASGDVNVLDETTFANLGTINLIPDLDQRMKEINRNWLHRLFYNLIRKSSILKHFEPANGERYVDDIHVAPDGSRIYVSRGGLGDIAAFDLTKPGFPLLWHTPIKGYKADHAALSPDGKHFVVSASLARSAFVFDTDTGKQIGKIKTGNVPHQNDYSHNGKRIYNASLGLLDQPLLPHAWKGPRLVTVADATTFKVLKTFEFNQGVRPSAITADESLMYAQLSFLNGVIKFDLKTGKILATATQPFNAFAQKTYPKASEYPHESVRHGLALSGDETKLCDAGTISNEVSIISTADMKVRASIPVGGMPYWATTSSNGQLCFVSLSADNSVSVIDYASMREVARVPVGSFPQRNRSANMSEHTLTLLNP